MSTYLHIPHREHNFLNFFPHAFSIKASFSLETYHIQLGISKDKFQYPNEL